MRVFSYTKDILEMSEVIILEKKKISILKNYQEGFAFPAGYMILGFKNFFQPLLKNIMNIVYISIVIAIQISFFGTSINNTIFDAIVVLSLIFFALPSTYAFYDIKDNHVQKIMEILKRYIITLEGLELIESNLNNTYKRVEERINFFKWIVKILWAIYLIYSKQIIVLFEGLSIEKLFNMTEFLLNSLVPFIIIIICISAYKRGMDILFKTIQFSFNEHKLILKQKDKKKNTNYYSSKCRKF